jgi:hypothetical protein
VRDKQYSFGAHDGDMFTCQLFAAAVVAAAVAGQQSAAAPESKSATGTSPQPVSHRLPGTTSTTAAGGIL